MAAQEGRFLHSMCRKTKMCKYYAHGRCNRRDTCDFAHSVDELRRAPDLSRTKVCPTLNSTGKCDDEHCAFAHCKADLRKLRLPPGTRPGKAATMPDAGLAVPGPPVPPKVPRSEHGGAEHTTTRPQSEDGVAASKRGRGLSLSTDNGHDQASLHSKSQQRKSNSSQKPLPGWDWGAKFHKTTLCAFHLNGKCNKGQACHFAHGAEELRPLPDLSCTKLCLQLLNTGTCNDANCRYAHTREELKMLPAWAMEDLIVDEAEEPAHSAPATVENAYLGSPPPAGSEDVGIRLLVKNTFLDIGEEGTCMPRRSRTQPTLPSMFEDKWPPSLPSTTPSTPRGSSSHEAVSPGEAASPHEPVPQMLHPLPPCLSLSPRSATSSASSSRVVSWTIASPKALLGDRSVSPGVKAVYVKNTFLTVAEPDNLDLPVKARSMPDLPLLADTDGTCTYEGSCAGESSSTVTPSLPNRPSSPSCCSSSESGDSFDFMDIALDVSCELPALPAMTIEMDHTTMVPICALQLVEKIPEEPEALIFDDMVTFPALRKKILKSGAMSAQNKPLYWEQEIA